MRVLVASIGIAVVLACGGRVNPESDGSGGLSGSGGSTGGFGGSTVDGTGGTTTVGGTGGTTVGGAGGTTVGGTGGGTTVGGTGGASGAGGTICGTGGSGTVPPDYRTCTGPGQCELTPTQCCACGVLGLDQLSAINAANRAEFRRWSCGPAPEACPSVGMADRYLLAGCETGTCRGFDVRTDPNFTRCRIDTDCMLRAGLGCCECNTTGEWVAISKVGAMALAPQVCGPNSVCPGCVPTPPAEYSAVCRSGACLMVATP